MLLYYINSMFNAYSLSFSAPPIPTLLPPVLYCDVPLNDGIPIVINWMVSNIIYTY